MVERDIQAVLVWSSAMRWSGAILEDLARRFVIRDVFCVAWTRERFASNLSRLYGDTLPTGSDKERESGTAPFLLVVIEDPNPRYARRRTTHGRARVNTRVRAARRRYRRSTGGGYRVHATLDPGEADKDLFLILGRRRRDYASTIGRWNGEVQERRADLVGTHGWSSELELLQAIEVCGGYVALAGVGDSASPLVLLVGDRWWAERIAQGTPHPEADCQPLVGSRRRRIELHGVGDGPAGQDRQQVLLSTARRDERGVFIPAS